MITIKPSLMDEWWVNFTMSLYEQGWLGMSFEKQLVVRESELNRYHVTYDIYLIVLMIFNGLIIYYRLVRV
jgi:hypothetical protein